MVSEVPSRPSGAYDADAYVCREPRNCGQEQELLGGGAARRRSCEKEEH